MVTFPCSNLFFSSTIFLLLSLSANGVLYKIQKKVSSYFSEAFYLYGLSYFFYVIHKNLYLLLVKLKAMKE